MRKQRIEAMANDLPRNLEFLDKINLFEQPYVSPVQQVIFNIVRTTEWTLPELPS